MAIHNAFSNKVFVTATMKGTQKLGNEYPCWYEYLLVFRRKFLDASANRTWAFVSNRSTRCDILSRPKDPIDDFEKCGVVYNIPSQDCSLSYVGQTTNSLKTRISQHKAAVRLLQTDKSALAEHSLSADHRIECWCACARTKPPQAAIFGIILQSQKKSSSESMRAAGAKCLSGFHP